MTAERFRLELRMAITREVYDGPDDGTPKQAHMWRRSNDRLEVTEDMDLGHLDFMGMTRVLGQLHNAVQDINNGRGPYVR